MYPYPDLLREWHGNPGASPEIIDHEIEILKYPLPDDYILFISRTNGGMGYVGNAYVDFWKIDELDEFNKQCETSIYAPGFLLFGTNGGNDGFGFDFRGSELQILRMPLIGMSYELTELLGQSFDQFMYKIAEGE
ncbi:SMI1/KNR4 family protein [Prosthecodimorpha staleyi]|uniref:SMI1/KNR4 family protein n=1 Tax=Prosthecodimorpha staleyi TaxID=2840188 RepID=A0A947GE40_9HYPH|nr:SMI1/KNR4 family protein [Prosthecodimorpha staleyi]MBT9290961.1 SMI1/KNR4 family protein [Prosthecodimorpha staleyi]